MKEQKVVITKNQTEINNLIANGWSVISITTQHVSTGTSYSVLTGDFCFLLER